MEGPSVKSPEERSPASDRSPLSAAKEGTAGAHWVLLDFGAVIVHVFAPPEREYYQLERLWADAPTLLRVQ